MPERRWEQRLLCADMIEVEWKHESGWTRAATAILEDISRTGACLQTDFPMPVHCLIRIHCGRKTLEGTVQYCSFRDIGYFVGVNFGADQHWTPKLFKPKYMMNPNAL